MELSRGKFEQLIGHILEKLKKPTEQALKDSGLSNDQIHKIIFVGGSTRIPAVQELVTSLTGKEGDKSVNPDEAVSLGAAIQAGILCGEVKDVLLLDVTPLSLGIETLGGVFTTLIEKNTTIPSEKSQIFSTAADNQPAVTVNVLQGERSMATDNKTLGRFDLVGIPPAPRGVPQIEVTFDIDANGIVHVSAKDLGTGKEQKITVTGTSNLSKEDIEKMRKEAEANAEKDKKKVEEVETVNKAETMVYSTEKAMKDVEGKIDKKEIAEITAKIEELKKLLEPKEKKDIPALKKKLEEVNEVAQKAITAMYQKVQAEQAQQAANDAGAQQAGGPTKAGKKEKVVEGEVVEEKK